jgi:Electron transfer DM13
MKFTHLAVFGIIAISTIGCNKEVALNGTDTQTPTATASVNPGTKSGNFQAGEHQTLGKVSVITEKGKRYLEFDQNFKTEKGPDVFVILYRSDAPPISGIKEKNYVSIAPLKKTSGSQRYALPDNVKLAEFKSVAIWCRQFNATFGYAVLPG